MSIRMAIINNKKISVGEGVEKKESSYAAGGNGKQYSHYGKQYGGFKNKATIWLSNPSSGCLLETFENIYL